MAALAAIFTLLPTPDAGGDGAVTVVDQTGSTAPESDVPGDVVPGVQSEAYAVFDAGTGSFLATRDLHGHRPIGSLMKLLTAWVVMQDGDPTRTVTVPKMHVAPDESVIGLRPGEELPRDVLLRAMLIVGANDAARALAVDVGGDETSFVADERRRADAGAGGHPRRQPGRARRRGPVLEQRGPMSSGSVTV